MSKKIGLGDARDIQIRECGRFYYPLVWHESEWLGVFSKRNGNQVRFTINAHAVNFLCNWWNWDRNSDKPRFDLKSDTSETDYLVARPNPFKRG